MNRNQRSTAAIILLLTGSSFLSAILAVEETRNLEPFTGIGVGINAEVYYTPGNVNTIRIVGEEQDVRDLVTRIEDGFLELRYEDWRTKHEKLILYITSNGLEKVSVSGSGSFRSEKPLNSGEMEINISGSGKVHLPDLKCKEIEVTISGSGSANLEQGGAEEMDVRISGSGSLNAEFFEVSEFSAGISGSGSCRITVNDELEARISGSGSVHYHGTPQIDSSASGSGKVRAL
jgi:hypothetical protein